MISSVVVNVDSIVISGATSTSCEGAISSIVSNVGPYADQCVN